MKIRHTLNEPGTIKTHRATGINRQCSITGKNIEGKVAISVSRHNISQNIWISLKGARKLKQILENVNYNNIKEGRFMKSGLKIGELCKIQKYIPDEKEFNVCSNCNETHLDPGKRIVLKFVRPRRKRHIVKIHKDCFESFANNINSYPDELYTKSILEDL